MKRAHQQKILILAAITLASGVARAVAFPAGGEPNRPAPPEIEYPAPDPDVTGLREQLTALQSALAEAREALTKSLTGVAEDERAEAITAFREENAGIIAQIQDLAAELRESFSDYRPERPEVPEIPVEVHDARVGLSLLEAELRESREAALAELPEDASPADVAAAIGTWREANAGKVADAEALRGIVADWSGEVRAERREAPPDVDPALVERREAFRAKAQEMRQAREVLRDDLRHAPEEERDALLEAFMEQRREAMLERRDLRRMERTTDGDGGNRRPGP